MNSDVIFNIFLVLSLLAAAGFGYIYMKDKGMIDSKDKNPNEQYMKKGDVNEKDLIDKSKLQDLFNIEEVDDDNIIHLKRNNGMRVIFSISTPDIYLLNDDEQHSFENALLNIALSLNFPVQFFTTTRKIETKKSSQKLLETINSTDDRVSPSLKRYSSMLYEQLAAIEQNRKINEIKNYCIVGISGIYDNRRASNELKSRIETIVKGFTTAKIKADPLEKDKVLQLMCDILNKGDNISMSKLTEADVFSSRYTTGSVGGNGEFNV